MDFWETLRLLMRRRYLVGAFLAATVAALVVAMSGTSPTYHASSTVLLYGPSEVSRAPGAAATKANPYLGFPLSLQVFGKTAVDAMRTPATVERMAAAGADAGYVVLFPRTEPAPIIRVSSDHRDPLVATRTVSVVTQGLAEELAKLQYEVGAPDSTLIRMSVLSPPTNPRRLNGSPLRALSSLLMAAAAATLGLTLLADAIARYRRNRRLGGPSRHEPPWAAFANRLPAQPRQNQDASRGNAGGAGRERRPIDAVAVLTGFLILLFGLPAKLVFSPLGAAGTPAVVWGVGMFVWWMSYRFMPIGFRPSFNPVRFGLQLFGFVAVLSYAGAFFRPIDGIEINAADRGAIALAAWLGIALLAADGVDTRERLDRLLNRVVTGGTFLAGLGILQFFSGLDVAGWYRIPGLHMNGDFTQILDRSGFNRVAGTTSHPIEFGVVLALILPVALHFAFHARPDRRRVAWLRVIVLAVAEPMAVSRSGILALAVAGAILFASWSPQRRWRAIGVTPVFLGAMKFVVPGLLGTIKSLFLNLQSDNSFTGRTDDYAMVGHYFQQSPILGRGWSTFLPDRYILLDNQYLGTLIEAGLLGLAALLLLFMLGIGAARGARRVAHDEEGRDLGQVLAASIAAAMVSFVTFDGFAFPMVTGTTFLLLGCAGALWRIEHAAGATATGMTVPERVSV